ncbi:hypothetical protein AB9F40_33535, partial [Rhizobium leguminosarum]
QLEFQCAFTADSGNDYHTACLAPVHRMIASLIHLPTRIVASDRLPAYSEVTVDIEFDNGDKWMEVCSISRRTDFPQRYHSLPLSALKANWNSSCQNSFSRMCFVGCSC